MAYEALMRSDMEALRSPATIMKLAQEQGALYEIERPTFFKSLETFDHPRSEGLVHRDTMLFINSIASVCLPREDSEYMESRWHELCRQMVIEITEEEEINHEALEAKRHVPGFSGMFALDDYGSGFANENSLLELSPRFIKVDIAIIRGISHYYETFHGVVISPEIARQAVLLSERYITDRFLPDKAIDLIDEACSDVNLKNKNIGRLEAQKKEHADYDLELSMLTENAEKTQDDYARMAELRSRNLQLDSEIAELEKLPKPALTIDNLARIIELWTKIPASKIRAQEYEQLLNLDAELKKHIVGQDEAIASVVSAIRRSRVGIQVKKHPVSFIFVGSTGVGKTELVKRLASEMFESVESLIRLDMSEYMEKHSVSKIIGSPPGYVGYDEAGQLTEKIRRRPYSVILFDELEKAHPDVLNILLQILDDGRITDAQGRVVNFENTIIIMTSNAGSSQKGGSVGFGRSLTEQSKEKAMKALSEFLRPEFINRVDEIVCFNQLSEENFRGIADIMLSELKQSLESRGIEFVWDESVKDYLVKKSYSVSYGARNLRRAIQTDLEDPIAERIIKSYVDPFSSIKATCEDGKIKLETV